MPRKKNKQLQLNIWNDDKPKDPISAVYRLRDMHKQGVLGGEVMPEDANPNLDPGSVENFHYFTLPMALNYQRNSYTLWQNAAKTYSDSSTVWVFSPKKVNAKGETLLRDALLKYRLALQPNKHINTWFKICGTLCTYFGGSITQLLEQCNWHIPDVLDCIQITHKKGFPYLSGNKIGNYWLYVLDQYTSADFTGRHFLSVAPDTHVIQASIRLGIVDSNERDDPNVQMIVSKAWKELLEGTDISPIDVHTPLWLWSQKGFPPI